MPSSVKTRGAGSSESTRIHSGLVTMKTVIPQGVLNPTGLSRSTAWAEIGALWASHALRMLVQPTGSGIILESFGELLIGKLMS